MERLNENTSNIHSIHSHGITDTTNRCKAGNNRIRETNADGTEVELAAPGVGIYSTWLDGGYVSNSGTSMAAPFVSGVAALVKSKNQSMTPKEIRDALAYGAIDPLSDIRLFF